MSRDEKDVITYACDSSTTAVFIVGGYNGVYICDT
jgi:hypothetical protein